MSMSAKNITNTGSAVKGFFCRTWAGIKEFFRKKIVSLKRDPKIIPLVMMFCVFLYYSLNLTVVSDTTAKIQGMGMGLSQFTIMLLSMLSLVCLMNAFPRRKKPNVPMLIVMFIMLGLIVYCDVHYCNAVYAALNRAENPIKITENTQYILKSYRMLKTHTILIGVSAGLVVLMPLYSKLLNMIRTSVEVQDNGDMEQIELSE